MSGAGFSTKLSSAGLVYKHYGQDIIAKMLGLDPSDAQASCDTVMHAPVQDMQLSCRAGVSNSCASAGEDGVPGCVQALHGGHRCH